MSSFIWERADYGCEWEVPGQPRAAYNYMKGFKSDGTSFLRPTRPLGNNRYLKTKYIFSRRSRNKYGMDAKKGTNSNCGGVDSGYIIPVYPGGGNILMGIGAGNYLSLVPGDTQIIIFSQHWQEELIAQMRLQN